MKSYDWEAMMIDDIMGEITPHEKSLLEAEMKTSKVKLAQYVELKMMLEGVENIPVQTAPKELTESVEAMIENAMLENIETNESSNTKSHKNTSKVIDIARNNTEQVSRSTGGVKWWQAVAAIGLLLIGIGSILNVTKNNDGDLLAVRSELDETKKMMTELLNESSTSQRIKGINVSFGISKPDQELIDVLVDKMNFDKSNNVRLAAIDALTQFSDRPDIPKYFVRALSVEKDPIVQIELIHTLITLKEKSALKTMEDLLENETIEEEVKDELHMGILKMT